MRNNSNLLCNLFMAMTTKHIGYWSVLVVASTLILFVVALFKKGFTHEMLLKAGVFLVSVKLMRMSHKNGAHVEELKDRLSEIYEAVRKIERSSLPR